MNEVKTIGIDLAKNLFALHGVDAAGKPVFRKMVRREKLLETLVNIPPCVIGMEACGGSHHWAREIKKLSHEVRVIAPQFAAPYRKSGKNDFELYYMGIRNLLCMNPKSLTLILSSKSQ